MVSVVTNKTVTEGVTHLAVIWTALAGLGKVLRIESDRTVVVASVSINKIVARDTSHTQSLEGAETASRRAQGADGSLVVEVLVLGYAAGSDSR